MDIFSSFINFSDLPSLAMASIFADEIPLTAYIVLSISGILLIASAFMSSSEVAFFSLSPSDIDELKEEKTDEDAQLLKLLKQPEHLLATILIGNNIVNVAIVILTATGFDMLFNFQGNEVLGFIINTVVLTLLLLLFGEIVPKVYAQSKPLQFSRFSSHIMTTIHKLFSPMSNFLVNSTQLLTKKIQNKGYDISVDDLSQAVDLIDAEKVEEKTMFEEIISFSSKTASEIMINRMDIASVDEAWDYTQTLNYILNSGYSRVPVYAESQDNIKGLIYLKDLIPHKDKGADFNWQSLIRKAFFTPENKPLDDLLEELRLNKIHMAIIVDEYGGTSGLVTMEDMLEEIVGDISDEYDTENLPYQILSDGSYLFEAKTPIGDFLRYLDIEQTELGKEAEDVDTLGGLFLEIKQDLPHLNDSVVAGQWSLKVKELVRYRITSIQVSKIKK